MFDIVDLVHTERWQPTLGEITLSFWRHGRPSPGRIGRMLATPTGTDHDRVERIGAWEKIIAWAQAHQCAEIAGFVDDAAKAAAREPRGFCAQDAMASAEAEVALILHTTTRTAGSRADDARELSHRYPRTMTALLDGRITLPQARAILDGGSDLDDTQAAALEEQVLGRAGRQTLGQLRESVRRAVLRIDSEAAERRHQRKRRERKVVLYPERDGMATLAATLPAAEAVGVYAVLDHHARACRGEAHPDRADGGDGRSMDARRADTLVDLVLGETGFSSAGTATARSHGAAGDLTAVAASGAAHLIEPGPADSTEISAECATTECATTGSAPTMPDSNRDRHVWGRWLTSHYRQTHDDTTARAGIPPAEPEAGRPDPTRLPTLAPPHQAATATRLQVQIRITVPLDVLAGGSDTPAELAGYGPIPAASARELAAEPDCTWHRLITDPITGALLDHGTTRYRPPTALRDHVIARHQTCQFPGCRTPAHRCDLDHNVPYDPDTDTGPTSGANLGPKCRPHHRLKGMPGWDVCQYPDGTIEWRTPSGHTYTVEPPP